MDRQARGEAAADPARPDPLLRALLDPLVWMGFFSVFGLYGVMEAIFSVLPVVLSARFGQYSLHADGSRQANAKMVGLAGWLSGVSLILGAATNLALVRCTKGARLIAAGTALMIASCVLLYITRTPGAVLASFLLLGFGLGQPMADMAGTIGLYTKHRHPEAVAQALSLQNGNGVVLGPTLVPYAAVVILGERAERLPWAVAFLCALAGLSGLCCAGYKHHVDEVVVPELEELASASAGSSRSGAAA